MFIYNIAMIKKIHSGLYCICFKTPENNTESVKFKLGQSLQIEISVQKYLNFFPEVILISQINLKKSKWEGSGKPADMKMTHYTDKIYETFCMYFKIPIGGYFTSNISNVYNMFRTFSENMYVDTKCFCYNVLKENNYNLQARQIIKQNINESVENTKKDKPIIVKFD
jgi:hypothetical protein